MRASEAERLIAALKAAEAKLCADNKAAMRGLDPEDRAELRAENVGHNVMLHEAIRLVRATRTGEGA